MTKNQLDNIIYFSFHFHYEYGPGLKESDPKYIEEKWFCYFNSLPLKKSSILTYEQIKNNERFIHPYLFDWIERWKISENEYNTLKEIAYLIMEINRRDFKDVLSFDSTFNRIQWYLDDLIKLFESSIDINSAIDIHYTHLHTLIENKIEKWMELETNQRTYNIISLGE